MKTDVVRSKSILNNHRLDALYYLSDGAIANRIIENFSNSGKYIMLSENDLVSIWQPNRNVNSYAGEGEQYIPYIQPYDILEYLPSERARLSIHQDDLNSLKIKRGTILQTCSGRNLGPLVIADEYLERFVLGSDLIRIDISDIPLRNYVFVFLSTWIGQAVLHSSKTGSVIDHLSAVDIGNIKVPILEEEDIKTISALIEASQSNFSEARISLASLSEKYNNAINVFRNKSSLAKGWTLALKSISNNTRVDAAFYDPSTIESAMMLKQTGGVKASDVADVVKPSGRYKTNYVGKGHGVPLVSGRQILQNHVVGMKYLPFSSVDSFDKFALREGYIAYPADGRVEGRLGTPVYITHSHDGWFASGHIGRIIAKDGISPGYIWLALAHPVVKAQIHALACGSVVDAVYPEDVENIVFPPCIDFPYDEVIKAWEKFDVAAEYKREACNIMTKKLEQYNFI